MGGGARSSRVNPIMRKKLLDRLRKLDREITKIDQSLSYTLYYLNNVKTTKLIKKREKLDLKRKAVRLERKSLTKMRYLKKCEAKSSAKK